MIFLCLHRVVQNLLFLPISALRFVLCQICNRFREALNVIDFTKHLLPCTTMVSGHPCTRLVTAQIRPFASASSTNWSAHFIICPFFSHDYVYMGPYNTLIIFQVPYKTPAKNALFQLLYVRYQSVAPLRCFYRGATDRHNILHNNLNVHQRNCERIPERRSDLPYKLPLLRDHTPQYLSSYKMLVLCQEKQNQRAIKTTHSG